MAAGLIVHVSNHSFRATGITAYLNNGGTLENAKAMAAHESPRTTELSTEPVTRLRSTRLSGSRFDAIAFIKAHADTWSEIEGRRICHSLTARMRRCC